MPVSKITFVKLFAIRILPDDDEGVLEEMLRHFPCTKRIVLLLEPFQTPHLILHDIFSKLIHDGPRPEFRS